MTVLVTGAAGFIGYHLSRRLLEQGTPVVGFDNVNPYYDPALKRARIAQLEAMACGVPALALACPNSGSTWVSNVPSMPIWNQPGVEALADVLRTFSADPKLLKLAAQQAKDRYDNVFCRRLWQEQLLSLGIAN